MRLLAQSLALPVAYQVFRMGFYGSLVPNTALAKSGGRGQWRSGWWYLRYFAEPYWLDLPLACLALGVGVPFGVRAWRAGDRRGLVALGCSRSSASASGSTWYGSAATTCMTACCCPRCSPSWHPWPRCQ